MTDEVKACLVNGAAHYRETEAAQGAAPPNHVVVERLDRPGNRANLEGPTDEERLAFKRQEREAAASIMAGDRYCPDPELQPRSVYLPMDCPVCGRHRVEWDGKVLRCEKCTTSSEWDGFTTERYGSQERPQSDNPAIRLIAPSGNNENRQPITTADLRWLLHNYGLGSVPSDDPSLTDDRLADLVTDLNDRLAPQERPSIDVERLALFFHEEYWSEANEPHWPREQADTTDCEVCWSSAAKLHALLSGPVGECQRFRHDEHCTH